MWEDLNLGHKGRTAQIQDGKSRLVVLTSGKLSISMKVCLHRCVISRMMEGLPCRLPALPLRGNHRVLWGPCLIRNGLRREGVSFAREGSRRGFPLFRRLLCKGWHGLRPYEARRETTKGKAQRGIKNTFLGVGRPRMEYGALVGEWALCLRSRYPLTRMLREEARESYQQAVGSSEECSGILGAHIGTDEDKTLNREVCCCHFRASKPRSAEFTMNGGDHPPQGDMLPSLDCPIKRQTNLWSSWSPSHDKSTNPGENKVDEMENESRRFTCP